jgi:hypothetical protein
MAMEQGAAEDLGGAGDGRGERGAPSRGPSAGGEVPKLVGNLTSFLHSELRANVNCNASFLILPGNGPETAAEACLGEW